MDFPASKSGTRPDDNPIRSADIDGRSPNQSALVRPITIRRMRPRSRAVSWRLAAVVLVAASVASCSNGGEPGDLAAASGESPVPRDQPFLFEVGVHCGVGWLGLPVDGRMWITDEANKERDWMPVEWSATQRTGVPMISLTLELSADGSRLTATRSSRAVVYRPIRDDEQPFMCE